MAFAETSTAVGEEKRASHEGFNTQRAVAEMTFLSPFKEGELRASLSRFLSPGYVFQAFNLPATSYTIWNVLEADMQRIGSKDPFPASIQNDVLPFLRIFFSPALVTVVEDNLHMLKDSFLGGEYALRRGKVVLAQIILLDIVKSHVCPMDGALRNFFGGCVEEKPVDATDAMNEEARPRGGDMGGAPGGGRGGRGGAGGRGGGRGGREGAIIAMTSYKGVPFQHMRVVYVNLPHFKTPPKKKNKNDMAKRPETLAERSLAFKNHSTIDEGREVLYDPNDGAEKRVHLYHGTRTSSLENFKTKGIDPPHLNNEFSEGPAFYVTNSLQHAVERPMHNHPGQEIAVDPPSVLVFDVDIEVLHGEKAPSFEDEEKFKVYWFQDDGADWLAFCIGNLKGELLQHKYDIVIGPSCIPLALGGAKTLEADLGGGVKLTQVACCSERARDWMGSCVSKVYCEHRASN